MEDITYQLNIRLNTPAGEQLSGRFFLGNSKDNAYHLFNQLEGREVTDENSLICFEFAEIENELPVNLKIIACNLEEVGRNIKLILKEQFKSSFNGE